MVDLMVVQKVVQMAYQWVDATVAQSADVLGADLVGLLVVESVDWWVDELAEQWVAETAVSKGAWKVALLADLLVAARVVQKAYQVVDGMVARLADKWGADLVGL